MFLGDLGQLETVGLIILGHMVRFCLVSDLVSGYPLTAIRLRRDSILEFKFIARKKVEIPIITKKLDFS